MDIEKKVKERDLKAVNVFIASFIAGLNEMGLLNQANVLWASRKAGQSLTACARIAGYLDEAPGDVFEKAKFLLQKLAEMLNIALKYEVKLNGDLLSIKIYKNTCRFCPKGVGGAELEGTLCPYPGTMHEYLKNLMERDAKIELIHNNHMPMLQEEDGCTITFKITPL